ncbi:hypothetical protein VCRA2113O415_60054 [Vibrio crassostreae]|nr:hypothetical protein VCRA2113O415_60054 [Vibrio crassostreae]CAK2957895.1 hypothetical protein VCRA2113O420_60055 [Vibrio crassostreae]CAK3567503.1 hypothetical protein VCRA2121O436_60054 [Vibrio crassostreae]
MNSQSQSQPSLYLYLYLYLYKQVKSSKNFQTVKKDHVDYLFLFYLEFKCTKIHSKYTIRLTQ